MENRLQYFLYHILLFNPSYPYKIAQDIKEAINRGLWEDRGRKLSSLKYPNNLYPILDEMVNLGILDLKIIESEKNKKIYSVNIRSLLDYLESFNDPENEIRDYIIRYFEKINIPVPREMVEYTYFNSVRFFERLNRYNEFNIVSILYEIECFIGDLTSDNLEELFTIKGEENRNLIENINPKICLYLSNCREILLMREILPNFVSTSRYQESIRNDTGTDSDIQSAPEVKNPVESIEKNGIHQEADNSDEFDYDAEVVNLDQIVKEYDGLTLEVKVLEEVKRYEKLVEGEFFYYIRYIVGDSTRRVLLDVRKVLTLPLIKPGDVIRINNVSITFKFDQDYPEGMVFLVLENPENNILKTGTEINPINIWLKKF